MSDLNIKTVIMFKFLGDKKRAAIFFCCHPRTVDRWIAENKLPLYAQKKLERDEIDRHWHGWVIQKNSLLTPTGTAISVEQMNAFADYIESKHRTVTLRNKKRTFGFWRNINI